MGKSSQDEPVVWKRWIECKGIISHRVRTGQVGKD